MLIFILELCKLAISQIFGLNFIMACLLVKLVVQINVSEYNNIPSIEEKKIPFIENVTAPQFNYIKIIFT